MTDTQASSIAIYSSDSIASVRDTMPKPSAPSPVHAQQSTLVATTKSPFYDHPDYAVSTAAPGLTCQSSDQKTADDLPSLYSQTTSATTQTTSSDSVNAAVPNEAAESIEGEAKELIMIVRYRPPLSKSPSRIRQRQLGT